MTALQQAANAVTQAAGWKTTTPDSRGIVHFLLDGDLKMEMLSPDGASILLRGDLGPLPQDPDMAAVTLKQCTQRVVGSCKNRRSVLSLTEGRLCLHRLIWPKRQDSRSSDRLAENTPGEVKDFLNDLAWWQQQLNGDVNVAPVTPSLFSFGGTDFTWPMGR